MQDSCAMCLLPGSPVLRMGTGISQGKLASQTVRNQQALGSVKGDQGRHWMSTPGFHVQLYLCARAAELLCVCLHTRDKSTRTPPTHTCVRTKNNISNHLWRNSAAKGWLRQVSIWCFEGFVFILCAQVVSLHVCVCTVCMPGTCRGQKRILDPWWLELWRVVNWALNDGNGTHIFCRSSKCS